MADTFLSKGASAVLGFDETVSMEFEMIARSMFFYNLTNEDISVVDAYNRTVNRIGRDNELEHAGLVYFDKDYSASNYTLSGNKPTSNKNEELSTSSYNTTEYDDAIEEKTFDKSKEYYSDVLIQNEDDIYYCSSDNAPAILNLPVLDFSKVKPTYKKLIADGGKDISSFCIYDNKIYYISDYNFGEKV